MLTSKLEAFYPNWDVLVSNLISISHSFRFFFILILYPQNVKSFSTCLNPKKNVKERLWEILIDQIKMSLFPVIAIIISNRFPWYFCPKAIFISFKFLYKSTLLNEEDQSKWNIRALFEEEKFHFLIWWISILYTQKK
jgi:hypothetical protein